MHRFIAPLFAAFCVTSTALAQQDDWHPMTYSVITDRNISPADAPYAALWQQEIIDNDQAYLNAGDTRYQTGHAPATEAHIVVRSPLKVAVLSVLDTGTSCTEKSRDEATGTIVKLCPMKTALYQGGTAKITSGRKACFLELTRPNQTLDPHNTVAYAAYDMSTRSIKLGIIVNHKPVPECSQVVPLYPFQVPIDQP